MSIVDEILYKHFGVHASYMFHQLGRYYYMTSDADAFDRDAPDACGCLWEGKETVDLSAFQVGFSWRF